MNFLIPIPSTPQVRIASSVGLHNDSDVFDSIFRHGPGFTREVVLFNFNHKGKSTKEGMKRPPGYATK